MNIRKTVGGGVAAVAIVGSMLFGVSTQASATALVYQNDNVTIKVSGGDAIALNQCINDAKDGFINTQQNACDQIASSSNLVQLENVSVWVYPTAGISLPQFSRSHVNVEVTGGDLVHAINLCLNDAKDGVINNQANACKQAATAGNLVTLSGVSVTVMQ